MNQLRFDNRVAVVTGAGNGLGREYALLLASRGAKVVVNDLGGGRDGSGKSTAADNVVQQIKDNGGTAVADYNSVVDGEKIIKTALDSFGRVDILINNAGILRDKSFAKMSDQDWDLIHVVHLKGAYKTTQAAWETFRKQKYGRVIMTSSNAGLFGNFGQANYSAAKLGLVGLANTLANEGAKYNIKVNTIVPTAASRLTEDILPPDLFKAMQPVLIAPVVVYMCHESFTETGNIIDSTLGYAVKTHLVRSKGTALRKLPTDPVTIESVKDQWPEVTDMSTANHEENITNVLPNLVAKLREFEERVKLSDGKDSFWSTFRYNAKDLSLYALGVGATTAAESDLKFLYESHENFTALPSYFMLAGMSWQSPVVKKIMQKHGKHADFTNILHVEQYIEFPNSFPGTEGEYTTHTYVADLLDKGSSAIVIVNTDIYDNKELFYRTQEQIFVLGQGGFGGPRSSKHATEVVPVPKRTQDAIVEQKTSEDQAALYRLSGDWNPLHIDPSVSSVMGHKRPLLHGLATLGFAARHVLAKYGGNDPATFKAMKARFVKPVFPGQTIVTEMWLEGNRVCFQAKTKETGNIVISGAYVDMRKVVSSATASVAKL